MGHTSERNETRSSGSLEYVASNAEAAKTFSTKSRGTRRSEYFEDLMETISTKRDKGAFIALFNYFAPRVKAFLILHGADSNTAEEITQEVMLTVWQKADKYERSKAAVSTWLFTIARNRRIDVMRKERRRANLGTDLDFHQPDVEWPDSIVDRELRNEKIRNAIAELPDKQAAVLQKGFFEGKSHAEISEELGIALGTVKSRTHLAYGRLRHSLAGEISL